jgi:hypothetical protein
MTPTEQKLADLMRAKVAEGTWTVIDGSTIRWMSEPMLPNPRMLDAKGQIGGWPGDSEFHRIVFLSFIPRSRPGTGARILGVARAPWVGRMDSPITFKRAFEALADPAALFV